MIAASAGMARVQVGIRSARNTRPRTDKDLKTARARLDDPEITAEDIAEGLGPGH
jgi:hypothetical protein